jgi:hypothetical protein
VKSFDSSIYNRKQTMSAFSTVVGRLGELSESELKQLYLIVGVRLGIQDATSAGKPSRSTPNKSGKVQGGKTSKTSGGNKSAASKGNPQRKSQWETHPLYREYKRLKKVVETQATESKIAFAAVDTPERAAYNQALSQWLEAKSSFRDHSGPAKEGAEKSSAKGKEKAASPAAPKPGDNSGSVAGPSKTGGTASSGKTGESWADEVQDAMDTDGGSDEESEPEPAAKEPVPTGPPASHKKTASEASLPSRGTPPKKTLRGAAAKK